MYRKQLRVNNARKIRSHSLLLRLNTSLASVVFLLFKRLFYGLSRRELYLENGRLVEINIDGNLLPGYNLNVVFHTVTVQ